MKLDAHPFEKIARGEKTVELRLNDEKRRKIAVDDVIVFSKANQPDRTLKARVIALHRFNDFAELYSALPLNKCGYCEGDSPSPGDMEAYYSNEEQRRWGVLGIEISLL